MPLARNGGTLSVSEGLMETLLFTKSLLDIAGVFLVLFSVGGALALDSGLNLSAVIVDFL